MNRSQRKYVFRSVPFPVTSRGQAPNVNRPTKIVEQMLADFYLVAHCRARETYRIFGKCVRSPNVQYALGRSSNRLVLIAAALVKRHQ
jgi:hypothetical protein